MKTQPIFICFLILISIVASKLLKSSTSLKGDTIGESSNKNEPEVAAKTFGKAKSKKHSPTRFTVSAKIVKDVEEAAKRPRSEGREPAEEIITEPAEYYDGSKDLNKIYVNCHLYEVETDCFHQNNCGWCDSKGKCIMGNKMGPLESCALESYRFH